MTAFQKVVTHSVTSLTCSMPCLGILPQSLGGQRSLTPKTSKAWRLNRTWSKLVKWVSNHFLGSCHIKKKAFYSSLGHSGIPVQFSETSLNCTNQSIRGEIVPPIRAYDKGGILINNSAVQLHGYKVYHTKSARDRGASRKQAKRASYL